VLSKDALCFFEENNQFETLVNSITCWDFSGGFLA
jgi:hypothetical protein